MTETTVNDPISAMRLENRKDLSTHRIKNRDDVLKQQRVSLLEAEALVATITLQQFKELYLKLKDKKVNVEVLKAIKNSCCSPARTEAFMKTENSLNILVRFLVGRDAAMQLEAAACFANLACGSHRAAQRIGKLVGPYLVSFLGSGSFYLRDQCAWACGNIANCCFDCFSQLKTQGLVPALLANIQSPIPDVVRSTVFALYASTKYEDQDLWDLTSHQTIQYLLSILDRKDIHRSSWSDASFTVSNIFFLASRNSIDIPNSIIETIVLHLEYVLTAKNKHIMLGIPLIRCLGFASHIRSTCLYLFSHPKFKTCISLIFDCDCHCLIMELIWVLTNISVFCDLCLEDIDLNKIFTNINLYKPADVSIVQVLYFLCIWASRNENVRILLRENEYFSTLQNILVCADKTVETGTKVLLQIIN